MLRMEAETAADLMARKAGGSIRDELAIEAANAAGITMYFTGSRHFYH